MKVSDLKKEKRKIYTFSVLSSIEKEFSMLAKLYNFSKSRFVETSMKEFIEKCKSEKNVNE